MKKGAALVIIKFAMISALLGGMLEWNRNDNAEFEDQLKDRITDVSQDSLLENKSYFDNLLVAFLKNPSFFWEIYYNKLDLISSDVESLSKIGPDFVTTRNREEKFSFDFNATFRLRSGKEILIHISNEKDVVGANSEVFAIKYETPEFFNNAPTIRVDDKGNLYYGDDIKQADNLPSTIFELSDLFGEYFKDGAQVIDINYWLSYTDELTGELKRVDLIENFPQDGYFMDLGSLKTNIFHCTSSSDYVAAYNRYRDAITTMYSVHLSAETKPYEVGGDLVAYMSHLWGSYSSDPSMPPIEDYDTFFPTDICDTSIDN